MSKYRKIITAALLFCLLLSACGQSRKEAPATPEPTLSPQAEAYAQARTAYEDGDYAAAREIFAGLGDYEDSAAMAEELGRLVASQELYAQAAAFQEAGDNISAYRAFAALGDYEDSAERLAQVASAPAVGQALAIAEAQPGDIVVFGEYEQDNDPENGQEALEWLVLDRDGSKVFLLTRYAVDAQPYDTGTAGTTWENCSLRVWLNGAFLETAFSPEHRSFLCDTLVANEDNEEYHIDAGDDTLDKVFLLSINEAAEYFPVRSDNWTVATDYAKAQGAWSNPHWQNPEYGNCWWWTRSPGAGKQFAALVESDGNIKARGDYVFRPYGSDRPATWVDTSVLLG